MKKFICILFASMMVISALAIIGTVSSTKVIDSDIITDTTWYASDNPHYVTKNVTVKQGATLTVQPGVNVYFANGTQLVVAGTLKAIGSFGKRINFTANATSPLRSTWRGILFTKTTINCTLDYCNVSYAKIALNVWSNNRINITRCNLSINGESAVQGHHGDLNILECLISYNYNATRTSWQGNSWAVGCFDRTTAYIANNTVVWNYDPTDSASWYYGIYATQGSNVKVYNNTISRNNYTATWSSGSGVAVDRNGYADVWNNSITYSAYGISGANHASFDATKNNISYCTYGIYPRLSNYTMRYNSLYGNSYSLYSYDANGTIEHNEVVSSLYIGLYIVQMSYYSDTIIKDNNITYTAIRYQWASTWLSGVYCGSWTTAFPNYCLMAGNNISYSNDTGAYFSSFKVRMRENVISHSAFKLNLGALTPTNTPPGVYVSGCKDFVSENDKIYANAINVFSTSNSKPLFRNESLNDSSKYDMLLVAASKVQTINCTYAYKDIYYNDAVCELQVCDWVHVNATYNNAGVPGASVSVLDSRNTTICTGSTDSKGNARYLWFLNFSIQDKNADRAGNITTESSTFNPHNVSAMSMQLYLMGYNVTSLNSARWVKIKMEDISSLWIFWPNGHVVSGSESYTGKNILCGGDIYVPAKTELEFDSVYLAMMCAFEGQHRIQVNDTGWFNLTRTKIEKYSTGGYLFILAGTTRGANMNMDRCDITYLSGSNGLDIVSSDRVRITNSSLKLAWNSLITVSDSDPYIYNNTISRPGLSGGWVFGINVRLASAPVVDKNTINQCQWDGIYVTSTMVAKITRNNISSCYDGLYIVGSSPKVSRNVLHHNTYSGVEAWNNYAGSIDNNTIYNNPVGVRIWSSPSALIERNDIRKNSNYGISLSEGGKVFSNNITGNGMDDQQGFTKYGGLYFSYGTTPPDIRYNNISNNIFNGLQISCWGTNKFTLAGNTISNNGFSAINYSKRYGGVYVSSADGKISQNIMNSNYNGLVFDHSASGTHKAYAYNSTIISSKKSDVLSLDCMAYIVNSTMSKPRAEIVASGISSVIQQFYVDALVKSNGVGYAGAKVNVTEGGYLTQNRSTGSAGWTFLIPITYRTATALGPTPCESWTYNGSNTFASGEFPNFRQTLAVNASCYKVIVFENHAPRFLPIPSTYSLPEDTMDLDLINLKPFVLFDPNVTSGQKTVSVVSNDQFGIIWVSMNADGWNLSVDASTGAANDNWTGQVNIKLNAADALSSSDSNPFYVTVTPVNDAPAWRPLPTLTLQEGVVEPALLNLSRYVDDPDDLNTTLIYTVQTYTYSPYMDLYTVGCNLGINPNPGNEEFSGTILATLSVSDGFSTDMTPLTIMIQRVNDPPFVNHTLGEIDMDEDASDTSIGLSYVFADPDNDPLTFGYIPTDNFTVAIDNKGRVSFAPLPNWNGEGDITFIANDSLLEARCSVHVVVRPVNDLPVMEPMGPIIITEGEWMEFSAKASDVDGDPLTYSSNITAIIPGLVLGSNFLFNATNGSVRVLADDAQVGEYDVTFSAQDPYLATGSAVVRITVVNRNEAPFGVVIISPDDGATFVEGQLIDLEGNASDPDLFARSSSESLYFKWESDLSKSVLGLGKAVFGVILPKGKNKITLTVMDLKGLFAQASVTVTVLTDSEIANNKTDTDGDGMPDWWEDRYGLDRRDRSDAPKDKDSDTWTNLEEYKSGTDPTDPNSHPIRSGDDDTDDDEKPSAFSKYWWILALIGLLLIVGILVLIVFIARRPKATEPRAGPYPPHLERPAPSSRMVAMPQPVKARPMAETPSPAGDTAIQVPGASPGATPVIETPATLMLPPVQEGTPGSPATGPETAQQPSMDAAPVSEEDPFDGLEELPEFDEDAAPKTEVKGWDLEAK